MISEREAIRIFGEEAVGEYRAAMDEYLENVFVDKEDLESGLGEMVSLPFMSLNLGYDKTMFTKKALVVVHPGHTLHSEYAGELYTANKEEYGDYHTEYLPLLMERLREAKESGETVLLYAMTEYLEKTLDFVGGTDRLVVVPTRNDGAIEKNIIGVSVPKFLDYLKARGVEKAEVSGEWNAACVGHVERILSKYEFEVENGVRFPLSDKYKRDVLFTMTKEEKDNHIVLCEKIDEWERETYSDYLSSLNIERGTCEANMLKFIIQFSHDPHIHPIRLYGICFPHDSARIGKALEFLKDNGVVKMVKAKEMLSEEITSELDIDWGSPYERFEKWNRRLVKDGHPEVDFVVVPQIECELV